MMVSQAISKGDVQAVNYFVAQKYVEALKESGEVTESENLVVADGGDQHSRLSGGYR